MLFNLLKLKARILLRNYELPVIVDENDFYKSKMYLYNDNIIISPQNGLECPAMLLSLNGNSTSRYHVSY